MCQIFKTTSQKYTLFWYTGLWYQNVNIETPNNRRRSRRVKPENLEKFVTDIETELEDNEINKIELEQEENKLDNLTTITRKLFNQEDSLMGDFELI